MGNCIFVATPYCDKNDKISPNIEEDETNKSMYTDLRSVIHSLFPRSPSRRLQVRSE